MITPTPELEPTGHYYLRGRLVFHIFCPVECGRSLASFTEKFGGEVVISGHKWCVVGLETYAVNAPLRVGESIGLMVDSAQGGIPVTFDAKATHLNYMLDTPTPWSEQVILVDRSDESKEQQ